MKGQVLCARNRVCRCSNNTEKGAKNARNPSSRPVRTVLRGRPSTADDVPTVLDLRGLLYKAPSLPDNARQQYTAERISRITSNQ